MPVSDDGGPIGVVQAEERERRADVVVEVLRRFERGRYLCDTTEAIIYFVVVLPTEPVIWTTGM